MIPSKLSLDFVEEKMLESQNQLKGFVTTFPWPPEGPCPGSVGQWTKPYLVTFLVTRVARLPLKHLETLASERQIHQQHTKCNREEAKHKFCKIFVSINLEILRKQIQTIYTTPLLYLLRRCLFTRHRNKKKQTSWPSKLFKLVSTCFCNLFNSKSLWGSNSVSLLPNPKKISKNCKFEAHWNNDFDHLRPG